MGTSRLLDLYQNSPFCNLGKELRNILMALATIGIEESFEDKRVACMSVASPCKVESFSIYLHISRVASYLHSMVSVFSSLFRRLAILPPICEFIFRHVFASVHSSLKLDLPIGWVKAEPLQKRGLIPAINWLKIHTNR